MAILSGKIQGGLDECKIEEGEKVDEWNLKL